MQAKVFFAIYLIAIVGTLSVCIHRSVYTRESLTFAYCEFSESIDTILFGVRNNGNAKVIIVDLIINQISILESYGVSPHAEIEAGELQQLGLYWNWTWGYNYTIGVVTARGARFAITEKAIPAENLLTVDNVIWNTASNTTTIIVRNTGVRMRKIMRLYIYTPNRRGWAFCNVTQSTNIPSGLYLAVNQHAELILEWPNSWDQLWTSNTTYQCMIAFETSVGKIVNSTSPS